MPRPFCGDPGSRPFRLPMQLHSPFVIFLLAFGLLLAAGAAWTRRYGRPAPGPFRDRPCQGRAWKQRFPAASKDQIRSFLGVFASSFDLHPSQRLNFAPDDRVMDVYTARYPHRSGVDTMELEILAREIQRRYEVNILAFWSDRLTLGELFLECDPARG